MDALDCPVPPSLAHLRRFALDGALLLFDRDTGLNALCDGPETAELRQVAPRAVQFGITNRCNLACTFCSRDLAAQSGWTADEAFRMLSALADAGVLEVAFGGGEPWVFPGFAALVCRLHDETPLAVSFTTNGLALTPSRLAAVGGRYGQLRLSLYDDNDWRRRVADLAAADARFGVNFLVTPARLPTLEATVIELASLGCRDVLLLSYNGHDASLHLAPDAAADLARRVSLLARALARRCQIKLDVCWGDRMEAARERRGAVVPAGLADQGELRRGRPHGGCGVRRSESGLHGGPAHRRRPRLHHLDQVARGAEPDGLAGVPAPVVAAPDGSFVRGDHRGAGR